MYGGAGRDRTDDLYNAIVALSQLSYGPKLFYFPGSTGKAPWEMPEFRGAHFMNAYAPRQVLFFYVSCRDWGRRLLPFPEPRRRRGRTQWRRHRRRRG